MLKHILLIFQTQHGGAREERVTIGVVEGLFPRLIGMAFHARVAHVSKWKQRLASSCFEAALCMRIFSGIRLVIVGPVGVRDCARDLSSELAGAETESQGVRKLIAAERISKKFLSQR